jgi:hypothetical protein
MNKQRFIHVVWRLTQTVLLFPLFLLAIYCIVILLDGIDKRDRTVLEFSFAFLMVCAFILFVSAKIRDWILRN